MKKVEEDCLWAEETVWAEAKRCLGFWVNMGWEDSARQISLPGGVFLGVARPIGVFEQSDSLQKGTPETLKPYQRAASLCSSTVTSIIDFTELGF